MPATLIPRPYAPSDRNQVLTLFRAVNRALAPAGMEEAFDEYVERSIADEMGRIEDFYQAVPGSGFWVIEEGGAIIAMVGIERISDDEAELRRMYVDGAQRRRGIGTKLLDHVEAYCRNAGYARMILSTAELQAAARATYEARGYERVKVETANAQSHKTVGGGIRRFHYVLDLTSSSGPS